jgi:plastocyanin
VSIPQPATRTVDIVRAPRVRRRVAQGAVLAGLAALAGCTNAEPAVNKQALPGSATASMVNGAQQVHINAGDDYRFRPSNITVHPGRVRIVLHHTGSGAPHDWELVQFPADFVPQIFGGQTASATFTAPAPGRYKFECTIHVRQGQIGYLTVKPGP